MKALEGGDGIRDRALLSPMPGTVTKIFRAVGHVVKKG